MQATLIASPATRQSSIEGPDEGNVVGQNGSGALATDHRESASDRRLLDAFDALDTFPALAESCDRMLTVISKSGFSTAEATCTLESDVALTIAALRVANRKANGDGRVDTAHGAVAALSAESLKAVAGRICTFEFFQRAPEWDIAPERFRQHALATQRIADRLARAVDYEWCDRLSIASLLHDVGKLVLLRAYPSYPEAIYKRANTPEERIRYEQRVLGIDHALIGGALVRRWGLPNSLATTIEHHHESGCEGDAAFIRLADMLAHHERGESTSPRELIASARAVGLERDQLRRLMYELPTTPSRRLRHVDPCPLTTREHGILRLLSAGKVYKEIAADLGLSTSTVRTYLHRIYRKLSVIDRAQAVLLATERGWLQ